MDVPNNIAISRPVDTKIGLIGAGGAASSILSEIHKQLPHLSCSISIDDNKFTNVRANVEQSLSLSSDWHAGSRTIENARAQADSYIDFWLPPFLDADVVFVISGLGGVIGTGFMPSITKALSDRNIFCIALPITPFEDESIHRKIIAREGMAGLRQSADITIEVSNERLSSGLSLLRDIRRTSRVIANIYKSIVNPIFDVGLFKSDVGDVKLCLAGHGVGYFTTNTSCLETILRSAQFCLNELEAQAGSLQHCKGLVVCVEGSKFNIMTRHLNDLRCMIKSKVKEGVPCIFFPALNENLAGKFRVSILTNF